MGLQFGIVKFVMFYKPRDGEGLCDEQKDVHIKMLYLQIPKCHFFVV